MNKLIALIALLKEGNAVADAKKWKKRQITVTILVPVLLAAVDLSRAYGWNVPLDHDSIVTIAGFIIVVVNIFLTLTTSRKIGVGTAHVSGVEDPPASTPPADVAADDGAKSEGGDPEMQAVPGLDVKRTNPFRDDTGA